MPAYLLPSMISTKLILLEDISLQFDIPEDTMIAHIDSFDVPCIEVEGKAYTTIEGLAFFEHKYDYAKLIPTPELA